MITLTVELTPEQAAGLARFAEKIDYETAMSVLYPHIAANIRADQAHQILCAFSALAEALADADIRGWPWIDTGRVA